MHLSAAQNFPDPPADAGQWYRLGARLQEQGQVELAVPAYRTALVLDPADPDVMNNLGNCEVAVAHFAHAVDLLERTIRLVPMSPAPLFNLGVAFYRQGLLGDAEEAYVGALMRDPDFAEAHTNMGSALVDMNRLDEAIASHRSAIVRLPGFAKAYNNLGVACENSGRAAAAEDAYGRALRLQTLYPTARYNLSHVQLLRGNFEQGWRNYQWRWRGGDPAQAERTFAMPRWDGDVLPGMTLLLHGEQGLGDVLQFARYAPLIAARGIRVVLEVYRPLVRLMQSLPGVAEVIARGDPLPPADRHLPLLDAPVIFGTTLASVPAAIPTLTAEPELVTAWRAKLPPPPGLTVGLVWAGDPRPHDHRAHAIDQRRSLPLAAFAPLLRVPGVAFVSLQMGRAAQQIDELGWAGRLTNPMPEVGDFADTAALMAGLDLIITVDTAVAHLAGALGKPVWVLSRFDGCWRWLEGRDDSPWYPTLRLFRQSRPGRWDDVIDRAALALLRTTVALRPDSAESCHALGAALRGSGMPAVATLRRALVLRPCFADGLNTLGIALRDEGLDEQAAAQFAAAVDIQPDHAEALHNLGNLHQLQGRLDTALSFYRRALAAKPDYAAALHHAGIANHRCGDTAAAARHFARAAAMQPDYAEAHNNLAAACLELGRPADAEAAARQAWKLRPDYAEGLNTLAAALNDLGRWTEASVAAQQAIYLHDSAVSAHNNLGNALRGLGLVEDAVACYRRAIVLDPGTAPAPNNLGVICQQYRMTGQAEHLHRRAVRVSPGLREPHINLATALLRSGHFDEGWREFAWRRPARLTEANRPAWGGERLDGKTILLLGEQGHGDVLQFARYAAGVAGQGGRVIVRAHPVLCGLLRRVPGVAEVVSEAGPEPDFDVYAPLLSLPALLNVGGTPLAAPYVSADPERVAAWSVRLRGLRGLRVGLVWAGDPRRQDPSASTIDARRSIALFRLLPLLKTEGVAFVSLQTGEAGRQCADIPPALRPFDVSAGITDFDDTAAIIATLDLVITVDTATAHLAGAMGKPVWILSRFDGCWRWLENRDDSPWYPSARLFRQDLPGAWEPVIARVAQVLAERVVHHRPAGEAAEQAAIEADFASAVRHHRDGRVDGARDGYRTILVRCPQRSEVLNHLGLLAQQAGALDEALRLARRAVWTRPLCAETWSNLGIVLSERGETEQGQQAFRTARLIAPDLAEVHANLARTAKAGGDLEGAIRLFRIAVRLNPQHPEIRSNLGAALLTAGDLAAGFREHEWRLKGGVRTLVPRAFDRPVWDGADPSGKTILLYAEQGLGDTLQFVRYASLLAVRGATVVLEVYRPLTRLLSRLPGVSAIVATGDPLPPFDAHLSLISAPFAFGTTLESVPAPIPTLRADPRDRAAWQRRLAEAVPPTDTRRTVGLVWAGDPRPHDPAAAKVDRWRSLPLDQLLPLLSESRVRFVSLQMGEARRQLEGIPAGFRPLDPMGDVTDFADTAGLVETLDLVITVDTAVAHLAGGLGKPVWILSRFDGCWRWLKDRDDSPWYPTARLFHQRAPGDWPEVVGRLREALAAWLDSPDEAYAARRQTALDCHLGGRFDAAAAAYAALLADRPNDAWAWRCLGLLACGSKQPPMRERGARETALDRAVRIDPGNAEALNNLGIVHNERGDQDAAETHYRRALVQHPAYAMAYNGLGKCRADDDRPASAIHLYRRALTLDPAFGLAETNLGAALLETGALAEASPLTERLLSRTPDSCLALNNLAVARLAEGRWAAAATAARRSLALDADAAAPHLNLAMALLAQGDFAAGWAEYEWRRTTQARHAADWTGQPLRDRSLLLIGEQGFGDVLQFVRFASPLADRGATVIVQCAPPLQRLLATVPGVATVVTDEEEPPPTDYALPLLSVPLRLGLTLDALPGVVPYLRADSLRTAAYAARLPLAKGLRVGLVWAGASRPGLPMAAAIDAQRSIALPLFRPLLKVPGITIVSLQTGPAADQVGDVPADLRPIDLMAGVADFADTAALVEALDLVITVDTAMAHLAGALGKPVWILSRHGGCWRWLDGRDDTPWYPSARLFRQTTPGDWGSVIERLSRALVETNP